MKIVIHTKYGVFKLPPEIEEQAKQLGYNVDLLSMDRSNPLLAEMVEKYNEKTQEKSPALKVVEVPDEVNWCIEDYDGCEWVSERHRTWC